jgi:hypothetical protein
MMKFKLVHLLICLLTFFGMQSSSEKLDKLKKNTSVFYLSDLIKSYENTKVFGDISMSKTNKISLLNQKINSKRESLKTDTSNYAYKVAELIPSCQVNSRNYSINIGDECETFKYPLIECSGYCHSKSMIWKTAEEIQEAECCKITSVSYISSKIYCKNKLLNNNIKDYLSETIKDEEIVEAFETSLRDMPWTNRVIYKNGIKYSGFYMVKLQFDASCECQNID